MIDALSLNNAPHPLNFSRFRIQPGHFTVLSGSESALKTLLFQILSGRKPVEEGSLLLDASSMEAWSAVARDRKIAVCEPFRAGSLKVFEVVGLGRLPHVGNRFSENDEVVVAAAMEWCGIAHFRKRVYETLSDSEQLQVRFARAAAQIWERSEMGSRYLLINEPLLDRDDWTRNKIMTLSKELVREMFGILIALRDAPHNAPFVTHQMSLENPGTRQRLAYAN